MAAIAFDTHEHIKALMKAGMPESQAEAVVNSQKSLADSTLVTKSDLHEELMPIKFMMGILSVGVGAIFMKLFLPH